MRSKTSFFNWGLSKSLLARCSPLFGLWLGLLIFSLPVNLVGEISRYLEFGVVTHAPDWSADILRQGIECSLFAFPFCAAAALGMFSFLYTSKTSGMIASLPIRRECVFVTCYLTGLVPLLLIDALTAAVTVLVGRSSGLIDSVYVWKWLWMAFSSTVAFYGMAVFCAMLTGSTVIMPLVYLAFNLAPYLAHAGIGTTLEGLLYGFQFRENKLFTRLSPVAGLGTVSVDVPTFGEPAVRNGELFGYYMIAGLVLSVCALLLYRKRRMESAGDIVAIKVLKPVFKYGMALGGACLLASVMYAVFDTSVSGGAVILFLVIGAFFGYFAAEMLLNKTVNVFRGHWKGFTFFSLALLAAALIIETDVFGYEKKVPDRAEIESAAVDYGGETVFKEAENIEKVTALHRQIIESKAVNEDASGEHDALGLIYTLKDGSTLSRSYVLSRRVPGTEKINPNLTALEGFINAPEAIRSRAELPAGCDFDSLSQGMIYGYYMQPDGTELKQQEQHYTLTDSEAADFYENCILPDAEDGTMLRIWPVQEEEYNSARSTLRISYSFRRGTDASAWKEFILYTDAKRCCQWIEENTPLVIQSIGDAAETVVYPVPVE